MKNSGKLLIVLSLIITLSLWLLSKSSIKVITTAPLLSMAQISALLAATLLAWNYFIATRISLVEYLFGGLDKVYRIHHIIGGLAYSLILVHPMMLIFQALPNIELAVTYIMPSNDVARTMGVFALYLFDIILIITFFIKVPYHIWKLTHNLIGVPLIIVFTHVLLISSDVARYIPLRFWMLTLLGLAIFCYIYKRFFYIKFGPRYEYVIKKMVKLGDPNLINKRSSKATLINELWLKPLSKPLKYKPGQFGFIKFASKSVSDELHPFSFSGSEGELLRVSIKESGDFTDNLSKLATGEKLTIYGPHGAFFEKFFAKKKDVVFIAGGIGVTPFLALLRSIQLDLSRKINLYYTVSNASEAVYAKELEQMAIKNSINFKLVLTENGNRLNATQINQEVDNLADRIIFMCGPISMMRDLAKQFNSLGIKNENLIYEEFSLRE